MLDEAEQRGLSVTQEEVDAEMAGQRKNYEEYEEVRSYIQEWCTKMGITTEQYFDMVAEQLPRRMLRQRLRDTLGQEYCAQHGLEFTKVNPPEQMTDMSSNTWTICWRRTARRSSITKPKRRPAMKRYYRKNRSICCAVPCVQPSGGRFVRVHVLFAWHVCRQRHGGRPLARVENRACDAVLPLH